MSASPHLEAERVGREVLHLLLDAARERLRRERPALLYQRRPRAEAGKDRGNS